MIAAIERWFAKRRKRLYRFKIADLYSNDVGLFCCRCKQRVPCPQAVAREWWQCLSRARRAGRIVSEAVHGPSTSHQCEDLK